MNNLIQHTPVEIHEVDGISVYVKREDLYGTFPLPPLGKLRGLRRLLNKYYMDGHRIVGCWDTRVSKLGQGLAVMIKDYPQMSSIISYPHKKNGTMPEAIEIAKEFGAEIYPIRGNHVGICYAQTTKYVKDKGGFMLPFGLECIESVEEIAKEFQEMPEALTDGGTIILSCGSGVTLAGILLGLKTKPVKIIGISSGRSVSNIYKCVGNYVKNVPEMVEIKPAEIAYNIIPSINCPFPSHPNYDLKAWKYLCENIHQLTPPILFWNIGA